MFVLVKLLLGKTIFLAENFTSQNLWEKNAREAGRAKNWRWDKFRAEPDRWHTNRGVKANTVIPHWKRSPVTCPPVCVGHAVYILYFLSTYNCQKRNQQWLALLLIRVDSHLMHVTGAVLSLRLTETGARKPWVTLVSGLHTEPREMQPGFAWNFPRRK